jgi:superfamily II DNA helicase RecQ
MEDFGAGNFPVISATMALGLGQNLKRVQCVIHMGRADPASIVQMVGRCGRDGKTGLGILFMEPTCKKGFNNLDDFKEGVVQTDDVHMDALAITNLCLQVALTVDNK